MTQMRKGIAAQMTRALLAPHAYVQMEVDATRLVAFRERHKKAYQAKEGLSLSFVPFVVKASAEALKRNPTFNAHWTEQGLLAKRRVNVGVAVAIDEGLIVPVIRDADQLSIHGLNVAIADVANRAKVGKFKLDDFGGGTFTVDNTGYLGTNLVMPILNVPEVGIVTMEAITKRPVIVSTPDGDVIAIRPVMNMVLGVDHRANDGAGGAALLRDIKAWLESVGPDTPIYGSIDRARPRHGRGRLRRGRRRPPPEGPRRRRRRDRPRPGACGRPGRRRGRARRRRSRRRRGPRGPATWRRRRGPCRRQLSGRHPTDRARRDAGRERRDDEPLPRRRRGGRHAADRLRLDLQRVRQHPRPRRRRDVPS
jgi:hypothetical protein